MASALIFTTLLCSGTASLGTETFRTIQLQVLQADGHPAGHRTVELHGFDRRALGPLPFLNDLAPASSDDIRKAREQGWLFTTDEQGDITARIGNFAGWEDKKQRPGWGTYIFVVQPGPNDAGAASQRFWIYDANDSKNLWWNGGEWGQPIPLPPEGLHLTMALQNGFTLYGQVVDDRDHRTPLPKVPISVWNDLSVDTHTGYGGQIFPHGTVTDANGEFQLDHLFNARLYFRVQGLWMTTDRDGPWVTQAEDVVDPPADKGLRLTLGVLLHSVFHYTGTVTNAQGKPVADADIIAGISSEPQPSTYSDEHNFEHATTDAQGHFDLAASSPWCRFISAEDKMHGRVDFGRFEDQEASYAPGRYDMQFPAKPNPTK